MMFTSRDHFKPLFIKTHRLFDTKKYLSQNFNTLEWQRRLSNFWNPRTLFGPPFISLSIFKHTKKINCEFTCISLAHARCWECIWFTLKRNIYQLRHTPNLCLISKQVHPNFSPVPAYMNPLLLIFHFPTAFLDQKLISF